MAKWIRIGAVVAGVLIVVFVGGVYAISEAKIRSIETLPLPNVHAATDAGAVARGARLATIYGCGGCHGFGLEGKDWGGDVLHGRLYTANLTRAMPHYSDPQLARAIRQGVRPDGSPLWGMPSESWIDVTDAEMADLLAWLRTFRPAGAPTPPVTFGPLTRLKMVFGHDPRTTAYVVEARARPPFDGGAEFDGARHLASVACSECHRSDFKGDPGEGTPDLLIAAAYDLPLFTRLMRTGIGMDDKEHGLMTEVSKERFSHLTDQEIAALHAYLTARAEAEK